jgi:hypothetical protein
VLGLEALVKNSQNSYVWLNRTHRFILGYAVVMSEADTVAQSITERGAEKKEDKT